MNTRHALADGLHEVDGFLLGDMAVHALKHVVGYML